MMDEPFLDDDNDSWFDAVDTHRCFASRHVRKHPWKVTFLLIGLGVFGIGGYFEFYLENERVSRPLFVVGVSFTGLYFTLLLEVFTMSLLNKLMDSGFCGKEGQKRILTVLFYMSGAKTQLRGLIWSTIILTVGIIMIPNEPDTHWEHVHSYTGRFLVIFFLFCLFWFITVTWRLHFSLSFNLTHYEGKILETFEEEYLLKVFLNLSMKPWFVQLRNKLLTSYSHGRKIHPGILHQVTGYIHRHDANGHQVKKPHVDFWDTSIENDDYGERMGKFLFNQLRETCRDLLTKREPERVKVLYKEEYDVAMTRMFGGKIDQEKFWKDKLDVSNSGKVSERNFARVIQAMYNNRRNLSIDLMDSAQVMKNMDFFIMSIFMLLLLIISLTIFGNDFGPLWVSYSGLVLASVFVWGDAVKNAFMNSIFLFSVRPFDVGDHIEIGMDRRDRFQVQRIFLQYTILQGLDGSFMKISNLYLAQQQIYNVSASGCWGFVQTVSIDCDKVNRDFIENVKADIRRFLHERPNSFTGLFTFTAREVLPNFTVKLVLYVEMTFNDTDRIRTTETQSECCLAFLESLNRNGASLQLGNVMMQQPYK